MMKRLKEEFPMLPICISADSLYASETTKTYNRLMNTYGEVCTDLEKPTLRSMRDVESAANMFYYTED